MLERPSVGVGWWGVPVGLTLDRLKSDFRRISRPNSVGIVEDNVFAFHSRLSFIATRLPSSVGTGPVSCVKYDANVSVIFVCGVWRVGCGV